MVDAGRATRSSRALRRSALPVVAALVLATLTSAPAHAAADDDTLAPGESLTATQSLVSADGSQVAVVEKEGVLSLYAAGGDLRWTSGPGVPGSHLEVRDNGDVALVDPAGKVGWHTGTKGADGARLVVEDDGDLVVRDDNDAVVWSAGTATPPTLLAAGSKLEPGAALASQDGRHTLVMGEDGDLQLLGPDARVRWSSDTDVPDASLALLEDGNLVVRSALGAILWSTATAGHEDATLVLQDDGDLVLFDQDGSTLWSTGTALGPTGLAATKSLAVGKRLDSPDGRLSLRVDADGLRLELDGHAVWAVIPAVPDEKLQLTLRKSGNLVLRGTDDAVYWSSETAGTKHAALELDAGGVVLRAPTGQELWRADVPPGLFDATTTATDCAEVTTPVPLAATVLTETGIRVHPCMVVAIDALLAAAKADGVDLGGWGWRSNEQQRALRARNCTPSGCRPMTATPGTSRHERGLAIDFTVDGRVVSAGSTGWAWLVQNAHSYGLKNLPGEPWHWSVDGW